MTDSAICGAIQTHPDELQKARLAIPEELMLAEVSELFKALSDPTRMKIISALLAAELCVCDLAELAEISQSAASHQLRMLRQIRLVRHRRDGKNAYYSLNDDHVRLLVKVAIEHVQEKHIS